MLQANKHINPLDILKASTPGASPKGAEDLPSGLAMEPTKASNGPKSSATSNDILNDKSSPGDACLKDAPGGSTLPPTQTLIQGSTRSSESKPGVGKLSINTSALNAPENSKANKSSATGNSSGFDATSTNNRARLGLDSANPASPYSDAENGPGADTSGLGSENDRYIPGALTPLSAVSRSHSPAPYPPNSPHPSEGGHSSDGRSPLHYPEHLPSPRVAAGGLSPAAYSPRAHSSDGQSPLRQSPLGDDEDSDSDSDDEFKNAVPGRMRGRQRPSVKAPTLPNPPLFNQSPYTPVNGPATDGPSGQSRNRFPVTTRRKDNVGDRFNRSATTGNSTPFGIVGLSIDAGGKRSRGGSVSSANTGYTGQGSERSVSRGTSPYRMPTGHRATIPTSSQYNAQFSSSNPAIDHMAYPGAPGMTMPISIEQAASQPVSMTNSYEAREYKIEGHNSGAFLGLPSGNQLSPQIVSGAGLYSHSPHSSPVHSSPQYPPATPEEILSQHSGQGSSPHHNSSFSSPGQLNGSSPPVPGYLVDPTAQDLLALDVAGLPIVGNVYTIPPGPSSGLDAAFILQQQQQQTSFVSGVPVDQVAYAQPIGGSPLTAEALAQYGAMPERKEVDQSVIADSGVGEYQIPQEDFDLGAMFGQQSPWEDVNPNINKYLIGVGQHENIYANQQGVDPTQTQFDPSSPSGGDHQEAYINATAPPSPKPGTLPWDAPGEQNAGRLRTNTLTEWQQTIQAQQQAQQQQQQQQMQTSNTLAVPIPARPRPTRRRSKSDPGLDLLGTNLHTTQMPTVSDEPQGMLSSSYQPTSSLNAHGQSGQGWQWSSSNVSAGANPPTMMQDDITLGMNEHAQIRPFRSLHATYGHKKARSQNPIIKVEDFSHMPGRLNALHNADVSPFNSSRQRTVPAPLPSFGAQSAPPFPQTQSFPSGIGYSQHHANAFSSEVHSNMGQLNRPPLNPVNTYPPPNPALPSQPVPQSSQAGPSAHQQYIPPTGTKQKQHGQRHEMDTKLLDGAFKSGSFHADPPLRVLLDLIRQQTFYMEETFEPSLETVEAEHLLAFVRQYAPQDPRFAPRITDVHGAYAPSATTNEPPKDSIYMLFTENNQCLLCGKQTDRSGRALGHVRSDLEHRPYHCDCTKCLSSPNPRKFFSDNLLDDHKKGQIVKQQCYFCNSSIRRGGMKRHMQSMHPGELHPTDDMNHTENEMD